MKKNAGTLAVSGLVPFLLIVAALGMTSSPASAAEPRVVKIKATDAMQYDLKLIQAKPGEALKVTLTAVGSMPKAEMAHNFILLAKGTNVDAFVQDATMARDSGYIPKAKAASVLASTKLAGGGETVEVVFNAPKEPGEYVYICTFPAHYVAGMKGKLVVK